MKNLFSKQFKQEKGAAMIIALFAMIFLFGVMVILFNTVLGEQNSGANSLNQQQAAAAAYAGEQQGVAYILASGNNNPTNCTGCTNTDYGTGDDGAITLSSSGITQSGGSGYTCSNSFVSCTAGSSYTLSKNLNASSLTIATGVTLNTNGYIIYVSGILTINSGGIIANNGLPGAGTGTTKNTTPGVALLATNDLGGSGAGGAGGLWSAEPGQAGFSAANLNNSVGGSGGAGGVGNEVSAGAGGTATAPSGGVPTTVSELSQLASDSGGAGGGGGGSGSAGGAGAGGGSGGGIIEIWADNIANGGTIEALGGNGGESYSGSCDGSGGGGGGGAVYIIDSTGAAGDTDVAGGIGQPTGSDCGTSYNGDNGSTGTVETLTDSNTGGSGSCTSGNPTWVPLNTSQNEAYCYTGTPSSSSGIVTVNVLGRVENYNNNTNSGAAVYTYQQAKTSVTIPGIVSNYSAPTGDDPYDLAIGQNNSLWFTGSGNPGYIGEVHANSSGATLSNIATGGSSNSGNFTSDSDPQGIALGSNGNLWFVEEASGNVAEVNAAGIVTQATISSGFSSCTASNCYSAIAPGPNDTMWFVISNTNAIGCISTSSTDKTACGGKAYNTFNSGLSSCTADNCITSIAPGPNGNMWFTEDNNDKIGEITTTSTDGATIGTIAEFPTTTSTAGPIDIAAGSDGNMWFTEYSNNAIGCINTAGTRCNTSLGSGDTNEYPIPTANAAPVGIATGADGNIWFAESGKGQIGCVTTQDTRCDTDSNSGNNMNEYATSSGADPLYLASGPDGNIWYTENAANGIGSISVAQG